MCNKFKKPTGKAGSANDFILNCQCVQVRILKKCKSSLMGEDSDNKDSGSDVQVVLGMEWLDEVDWDMENQDNIVCPQLTPMENTLLDVESAFDDKADKDKEQDNNRESAEEVPCAVSPGEVFQGTTVSKTAARASTASMATIPTGI